MNEKKRGQVTIFIIIGIILLFSTAIVVYIKTSVSENRHELITPELAEVANFASPVNLFVETCLTETTKDAFIELGNKGGYINTTHLNLVKEDPTNSDYLEFIEGSGIQPAYWHYLKGANTCKGICKFESQRPPLLRGQSTDVDEEYAIETQIDKYIQQNLPTCLRGFEDFKEFTIIMPEELTALTLIGDEDVRVLLTMPIEIVANDDRTKIDQFFKTIDFNFKKIYELATNLTNVEKEYGFVEGVTLDLLNVFSGVDKLKLPPMSATEFETAAVFWEEEAVKDNVQQMLQSYSQYFQIQNSLNYNRVILPKTEYSNVAQGIFDSMIIPITGFNTYGVTFNYFANWPIYFDSNAKGGIITPESIYEPQMFISMQRYNAVYDISYPLMISVADPYAFNNKGYTFRFAVEANIRNNEILNETFEPLESVDVAQGTMFCDYDKRNSGNITVKVANKINQKPIEDVAVSFTSGDDSCRIGKTDKNGQLSAQFPVALNGIITYEHENHLGISKLLTTKLDKDNQLLPVKLYPLKEMNIRAQKKKVVPRWEFQDIPLDIEKEENVMATLTRIGAVGEQELEKSFFLNSTDIAIEKLAPGNYMFDIALVNNKEFKVLPQRKCIKLLGGLYQKCYFIPEEEMILDSLNAGGFVGNITITENNLYANKNMILNLVSPDPYMIPLEKRTIEDIEQLTKLEEYSKLYKSQLEPEFR